MVPILTMIHGDILSTMSVFFLIVLILIQVWGQHSSWISLRTKNLSLIFLAYRGRQAVFTANFTEQKTMILHKHIYWPILPHSETYELNGQIRLLTEVWEPLGFGQQSIILQCPFCGEARLITICGAPTLIQSGYLSGMESQIQEIESGK